MTDLNKIKNNLSDFALTLKLYWKMNSFALERSKKGPWVKDIQKDYIQNKKLDYAHKNNSDPNFQKRFEAVFNPPIDFYFDMLHIYNQR